MKLMTYLDWAATTPLCEEAACAMAPYQVPGLANLMVGGNANSLHSPGRAAFAALEEARLSIARTLHAARPDEIIFTSGATEADNAALFGIVSASVKRARQRGCKNFVPHIITSSIEHDAVLAPSQILESYGCRVTYLSPDRQGFIDATTLADSLEADTVLVSVHAANNEIGSLQPIAELAAIAHAGGALFHTDAVQALGKVTLNLKELGVDAASFSAHKICGPKGVGALYLRTGTPFDAIAVGGGQEAGRRSGTQNVCGIVGFAAALKIACGSTELEAMRQRTLRDRLYAALIDIPAVVSTVEVESGSFDYAPNIVHVCVRGFESETLILRLDMKGFAVSGGSACSSGSLDPSHVLKALGIPEDLALGSLRASIGRYTKTEDIDAFVEAFKACIA